MNADVFVFGDFGNGYTQYPLGDDKKSLFSKSMSMAKSPTQIMIHREGNLMYYSYVRQLAGDQAIGFSMLLNGLMVVDIRALFRVFEESIGYLASNGLLIKVDNRGEVVPNSEKLSISQAEVGEACMYIRSLLDSEGEIMGTLPPIDYAVQRGGLKEFDIEDDQTAIRNFSHKMDYVVVYKAADYNTVNLNSTIATIKRLNDEKQRLQNELIGQKTPSTAPSASNMQKPVKAPKPNTNFVWSLISVFLCFPFGILALVASLKIENLYTDGYYTEAEEALGKSKLWCKVSIIALIIVGAIYIGILLSILE